MHACMHVLEGRSSNVKPVLSGVPQGSVLTPLLFLLYINDIGTKINSTIRLYADDALIYRSIQSEADGKSLQNDLSNLESWANLWQMKFNNKEKILYTEQLSNLWTTNPASNFSQVFRSNY